MKTWFDTEFIEDGKTIDLISIGLVREDGEELYLENEECDLSRASDWVRANVLPHLHGGLRSRRRHIADFVKEFAGEKPEFWGYYADYDWVVLCQLFGTMMDLPKGWPMYCRDIKQLCDSLGNPKLPEQGKGEHHALADARWNRVAWEFLCGLKIPVTSPWRITRMDHSNPSPEPSLVEMVADAFLNGQISAQGESEIEAARNGARCAIRTVLDTIAEPSDVMLEAGHGALSDCYSLEPGEGFDEQPTEPIWRAMIAVLRKGIE